MLTEGLAGIRYGYTVTDLNKTTPGGEVYSKLSPQAESTGLTDEQTVQRSCAENQQDENPYNPDGTLKADEKKLNASDKTEKTLIKKVNSEKNEHVKGNHDGFDEDCPMCECETCKNRRYKDESNDSAVSFQQATAMSPDKAKHMVRSHEMEHVRREQHKAKEEGKRIVSQSVQIKTDTCPECGDRYVSGGLTRTQTKFVSPEYIDLFKVGAEDITRKGTSLNQTA